MNRFLYFTNSATLLMCLYMIFRAQFGSYIFIILGLLSLFALSKKSRPVAITVTIVAGMMLIIYVIFLIDVTLHPWGSFR